MPDGSGSHAAEMARKKGTSAGEGRTLLDIMMDAFGGGLGLFEKQMAESGEMPFLSELFGGGDIDWAAFFEEVIRLQAEGASWYEAMQQAASDESLARYEQEKAETEERRRLLRSEEQELSWFWNALNAINRGQGELAQRLPTYMPDSVSYALQRWGNALGLDFAPNWPGYTAEGTPQMPPTAADWLSYIGKQGFPTYILR